MSNGREDARDSSLIRSVDRAVAILDLLAAQGWQAGAEVARELHVHRSTALRLLATLERHGLVERDSRTAKYRLGRRLVQLASAVRGEADVRQAARPVCEELEVGLNAVAAPVWSAAGEVIGALDVSGPAHRLGADDRPELVKRTREAAEELSRRLGYRPRGDHGAPNS